MVVTHSFKQHARQSLILCLLAGALSACGAGGGDPGDTKVGAAAQGSASSSPSGSASQTAGVLTFETPTVSATVQAGRSTMITVNAALTRPDDFKDVSMAYAFIIDNTGVILPDVQISQTGNYTYRAIMQTVPTLAAGSHKGSFVVKVCRDSNCVQQFPGSPMELPYDITVKAAGT